MEHKHKNVIKPKVKHKKQNIEIPKYPIIQKYQNLLMFPLPKLSSISKQNDWKTQKRWFKWLCVVCVVLRGYARLCVVMCGCAPGSARRRRGPLPPPPGIGQGVFWLLPKSHWKIDSPRFQKEPAGLQTDPAGVPNEPTGFQNDPPGVPRWPPWTGPGGQQNVSSIS